MKRYARVNISHSGQADDVAAYLPSNYEVSEVRPDHVIIEGEDNAGWTLDDYVIPRLGSGLYVAREIGQQPTLDGE